MKRSASRLVRAVAPAVVLAVALAACGTTRPARFYALAPLAVRPGAVEAAGSAAPAGVPLAIHLVRIPALVDRPQLVSCLSDHERRFDEYARWAEPLAPHLAAVLAENLSVLLAPTPVLVDPEPGEERAARRVRIEILHFDSLPGGQAVLSARWSFREPGAGPEAEGPDWSTGTWRAAAAAGDPASFAAAMSLNLLELGIAIAERAGGHPTH
ncbi:MAG TPA: PqiC family protein [Planctomycetota bacterium]|nr:PqiC family protein [Planctomycetota bacterium]